MADAEEEDRSFISVEDRTVFVTGDFDERMVRDFLPVLYRLDTLESESPIRIVLSSTGGDVDCGFAMYDAVRQLNTEVHIEAIGPAQSIAVLFLQSADKRAMAPNSSLLLHDFRASLDTVNGRTFESYSRYEITHRRKRYCEIIAERAGLTARRVLGMCMRETYLTPEKALSLGLIDEILQPKKR
jgi:ATP-dependent Clp protease, protease subunit